MEAGPQVEVAAADPVEIAAAPAVSSAASSAAPETGLTFPLDVSGPGGERLRSTVKSKLSEFIGSYTDDVLAEYVVVLVGHGKQQKQATADLEAFLGHQSETFVSWLWDHLTTHLNDYSQAPASKDGLGLPESSSKLQEDPVAPAEGTAVTDADVAEVEAATDAPTTSQKKNDGDESHRNSSKKTAEQLKRTRSPEPWSRRRKFRTENNEAKSTPKPPPVPEKAPPPRLKPSRRLIQFALRDAVDAVTRATMKKPIDASKRLRSVVSTFQENADSHVNGESDRVKQSSKVAPAMIIALKAAAAAAEDVSRPPDMELSQRKKERLPLERKATPQKVRTRAPDGQLETANRKKDAIPVERRAVTQKGRQASSDRPVPSPVEDQSQDVKEMRKRMRQVELEVSRLRTNQKASSSVAAATQPAPKVVEQATTPKGAPAPVRVDTTAEGNASAVRAAPAPTPTMVRPPAMRMPVRAFGRGGFMRGAPYMIRPPPRLVRPPYPSAPHLQWKRDGGSSNGTPIGAIKNGFRANVGGPIRHKRSLSYVRPSAPAPHPSTDATAAAAATAPTAAGATDEQKEPERRRTEWQKKRRENDPEWVSGAGGIFTRR